MQYMVKRDEAIHKISVHLITKYCRWVARRNYLLAQVMLEDYIQIKIYIHKDIYAGYFVKFQVVLKLSTQEMNIVIIT